MKKSETMKVHNVLMALIDRPAEPDRLSIDPEYIKELAGSILEIGLKNPITLCPRDSRFEIVFGDCRYLAFLLLKRDTIPAFIDELSDADISIIRASENLQRVDLTVIEEALIYKRLHEKHDLSWEQIAKRTGKTVGLVKRRFDLLKMPEMLIKALHEKKITYTVAEVLCGLPDLGRIEYYLGFCIDHGATIAVVRDWVKEEQSRERQKKGDVGKGDWGSALPEQLPLYFSCEVCRGPMELSTVVSLRVCRECHATIKQNM